MFNLDLNQQGEQQYFMVLDHIDAKDVNAISGSLIYGTPALTAIAGFVHNLNRKIHELPESALSMQVNLEDIQFDGFMVIAHKCEPKIYREHSGQDYTFLLKKAPLTRSGANPPIIEEGRLDYLSSLVIRFKTSEHLNTDQKETLEIGFKNLILTLRLAGGMIASVRDIRILDDNQFVGQEILQKVGLGYVLLSQKKLLEELVTKGGKDGLDYLLDTAKIYFDPPKEIENRWIIKTLQQEGKGWLVPLMVGYQAISKVIAPGEIKDIRNPAYESQFVEPIYSLGKWMLTYRLFGKSEQNINIDDLFWMTSATDGLYLVEQPIDNE